MNNLLDTSTPTRPHARSCCQGLSETQVKEPRIRQCKWTEQNKIPHSKIGVSCCTNIEMVPTEQNERLTDSLDPPYYIEHNPNC